LCADFANRGACNCGFQGPADCTRAASLTGRPSITINAHSPRWASPAVAFIPELIMTRFAFIAALAVFMAAPAEAQDITAGSLKISAPWIRATPKGASVGGGYMTIANSGTAGDRLVGGTSDVSNRLEIHEMSMEGGVMKMRPVAGLDIKPGQTVELKPGGYHVMFVGLRQPLEQGQHVKATLQFEKAGGVAVDFTVKGIGAQNGGPSKAHGH
jgi:periplasmic copper chaperone A